VRPWPEIPRPLGRLIRALAIGAVLLFFISAEAAEETLSPIQNPSFSCLPDQEGDAPCGRVDRGPEDVPTRPGVPPEPSVRLELVGCTRQTQAWKCDQPPILRLIGVAAKNDDPIVTIDVEIDGMPADCEGSTCDAPLEITPEGRRSHILVRHVSNGPSTRSSPSFASSRRLRSRAARPGWQVKSSARNRRQPDRSLRLGICSSSLNRRIGLPFRTRLTSYGLPYRTST
jgi:hypothetical protein